MTQAQFKGDVSPLDTWTALAQTAGATLVDVRTQSEWTFVGGPDLSSLNKPVHRIEWQKFPGMARNEAFVDEVRAAGIQKDQPIYLLCRSGVRSTAAGMALAEHGYTTYNIVGGFEGLLGPDGHRGVGGWRAAALPWKQT
ncbi:MAG: rhodanese-like domain-containing protein [Pseudomonadota bacterium]